MSTMRSDPHGITIKDGVLIIDGLCEALADKRAAIVSGILAPTQDPPWSGTHSPRPTHLCGHVI